MTGQTVEIVRCPPERTAEAVSLALCELAPTHRQEIAAGLLGPEGSHRQTDDGLVAALRGDRLCGAAWGQRQPGNTAVLWPPQLIPGEDVITAVRLAQAAVQALDAADVAMT